MQRTLLSILVFLGARSLALGASDYGIPTTALSLRLQDLASGALIFVALYNLALFVKRRNDRASFFLGLFSLLVLVQEHMPGSLPMVACLGPLLIGIVLRECFPDQIPRTLIHVLACVGFPLLLLSMFYPEIHGTATIGCGLAAGYLGFCVLQAVRRGEVGARVSALGFLILASVLVIINYDPQLPSALLTLGLISFTIAQSQIVTQRFVSAFRHAEYLSASLKDEIQKQTRDMSCILEHIQQGIFTVEDDELRVGRQSSTHLAKILDLSPTNMDRRLDSILLQGLMLSDDQKSQITSVVQASLGEDVLNYETNADRLSREALFCAGPDQTEKALEIEWTPMLAADQTVEKLLVCVRDVSEVRRLQMQVRRNHEDLRLLEEVLNIPEDRMLRFIKRTRDLIEQNACLIQAQSDSVSKEVVNLLFINMHTIKGMARTYLLQFVSSLSHEIEQHYAALRSGMAIWDKYFMLEELERLRLILQRYETLGREKLGWTQEEKYLKLPQSYFGEGLHWLEVLARSMPKLSSSERKDLSVIEDHLLHWAASSLSKMIEDSCKGLDSLARDLNKAPPHILFADSSYFLNEAAADVLSAILVHLLRNSLDHGLEAPELRRQRGKPSQGTITFRAFQQDANLYLEMEDDGQGLDLEAVEAKARTAGLLTSATKPAAYDCAQFIFHSGLSTKAVVTDISGRGVGLDAVRTYLSKLDASIAVEIKTQGVNPCPFFFRITLPPILWRGRILSDEPTIPYSEAV